ncbi:MAG: AAA family ATPase [Synergistaceae bacterium]|nr:AAA family ATPase [Synergistaceae bacterium]MBR0097503.1 AAA family ATPase [Synergistaceae bacterium]MBR0233117.1 AAA family ATPase [Synergistaceae bacterium]
MSIYRKAERRKAKLRLAITGPAGSGKTYSALLIAFGIGGKTALLDTENGSGDLYSALGDYDICSISAPFTVQKYIDAIKSAEQAGYDILILDSISAEWAGSGGLLNLHTQLTSSSKANSFAAWGQVTPKHNAFIDAIINSRLHIICTIRSKTEYAQIQNERGKTEIRKMGLGLVQREGIDYEFTTVFDLNFNHEVTVSKDRTSIFDGQVFTITQETGKLLKDWLDSGIEVIDDKVLQERKQAVYNNYLKLFQANPQDAPRLAQDAIMSVTHGRGSKEWTLEDITRLEADVQTRSNNAVQEELAEAV